MLHKDVYRKNNVSYWIKKECFSINAATKKMLVVDHLFSFGTKLEISLNDKINSRGGYIR
jgi:hypothetical protein